MPILICTPVITDILIVNLSITLCTTEASLCCVLIFNVLTGAFVTNVQLSFQEQPEILTPMPCRRLHTYTSVTVCIFPFRFLCGRLLTLLPHVLSMSKL
jgi:hypothetical protein